MVFGMLFKENKPLPLSLEVIFKSGLPLSISMSASLEFLVKEPESKSTNHPAILLLHGYGSDENDLFSFKRELPTHAFIFSLKAPLQLPDFGYAWYAIHFGEDQTKWSDDQQAIEAVELIKKTIETLIRDYPINPSTISLIGFSQGTIMSYALMSRYPHLIKNIIGLSGYINEGICEFSDDKSNYQHLEVFSSHGSEDLIIPVDWARKITSILEREQILFTYKEYPMGHGICPQNFFDFREWLNARI